MAAIRTIFWDIGGVILSNGWDRHQRARALGRLGVPLEEYEPLHDDANYYWERGLTTDREFFDATIFYKPRAFTFDDLWSEIRAEQTLMWPGSLEILKGLWSSRRYRTASLNNESRELNAYRLDAFELRPWFDFLICSGYVNEMKPAPSIYREAVLVSGSKPEECVFIDDKAENAEAATRQGMHGIHFVGPEQLAEELRSLGINW